MMNAKQRKEEIRIDKDKQFVYLKCLKCGNIHKQSLPNYQIQILKKEFKRNININVLCMADCFKGKLIYTKQKILSINKR